MLYYCTNLQKPANTKSDPDVLKVCPLLLLVMIMKSATLVYNIVRTRVHTLIEDEDEN